ncbi:hypothetical protein [Nostoc sp. PA-18-2419]|uniref:hypothetical protein n=1 Tax=Nostoc sp. PA-18-2419 TaxID=2575443 RepID=UPI00110863D4|nr:hypothetical protein [Nostoc sp. PA-18-2419]
MNSKQDNIASSQKSLKIAELNLSNITALSHNLPNASIIPDVIKESMKCIVKVLEKKYSVE